MKMNGKWRRNFRLPSRVSKLKKLSLLVASFVVLAVGVGYVAFSKINNEDANAADAYPYAGKLSIDKQYYESFESANLLPVNQVYAGDDILYVLTVKNISPNPESRFGSTVNIDDELSPDVMSDVHVEDIIINTTWLTESQIQGACGVNNSYVLHCSLSADLFSTNELTATEGDSIQIRVKAKATVHGTSDSYQLHNRAYVYSGDDVDEDGPDCKTLADAKKVSRCHSKDVVFCVVMPKLEVDKIVNKDGRISCYFYPDANNASKAEQIGFKLFVDNDNKMAIHRDVVTSKLTFPDSTLNDKPINLMELLDKKDITDEPGQHQANCMNMDGDAVNYDYDDVDVIWEKKKNSSEFVSKYWTPAREQHANDDPSPTEKEIEAYAKNIFAKEIVGTLNYTGSATRGFVDDQSISAGERVEYTITIRNTGSAVTKGGETDGVYIYDQFDPNFFENNDIYVQPLTGGVTCKVEQSKLTCYTARPIAPYHGVTKERPFTESEAEKAWDSLSPTEKEDWISKALNTFVDNCKNDTSGEIARQEGNLVKEEAKLAQIRKDKERVNKDLADMRNQLATINSNLSQAQQAAATNNSPALASLISALQSQIADTTGLITALEKQLSDLTNDEANSLTDSKNIQGIIDALKAGTNTCIDSANLYAKFEAKKNFIEWKITQVKTVVVTEGEDGSEVCIENCNPDEEASGYYMNGRYGLGSLVIGDEIKIRVSAIPKNTGEIRNIAYVGGGGDLLCPNDDTNSYCNSGWVTTFISAPELHINKELRNNTGGDMGNSIVRGTEAKYIIKVTNEGTADTKGMIVIHDVIPDYLEVNRTTLSLSFNDESYNYDTGFCEFRGTKSHELYCRAYDTIEGGLFHREGVWTIEFNVKVAQDADISKDHNKVVNYAYVYGGSDPVCSNEEIMLTINQAYNSGKINPYDRCYDYLGHTIVNPKLVVMKGIDKSPVKHGEEFNYWITVENKGDYETTAETTVIDYLPKNITILPNTLSGNCKYDDSGGGNLTCTIAEGMKPGAKQTFKFAATSTNLSGQITNNVSIFGEGDVDCSNDAAALNSTRCHSSVSTMAQSPIMKIETSASSLETYNGGQVAYLTTVRNIGNTATTEDTNVTIKMPNELRLLGVRASKGTCRIDLHQFECTIPAGVQPGETVYVSTLTQAVGAPEGDITLNSNLYGGGDPGCLDADETAETALTTGIFRDKVFAADTNTTDINDSSKTDETETNNTENNDSDKENTENENKDSDTNSDGDKTDEDTEGATPPATTGTAKPAQPNTSTNKRCFSNASVKIHAMPAWVTDIDDSATGAPSAGILSTMQALGTVSMLGVASYMILKSRKDFKGQEIA